jgi:hypothetical protein
MYQVGSGMFCKALGLLYIVSMLANENLWAWLMSTIGCTDE